MKISIKILVLALFGVLLINTGCDKEKVEEDLGITFTVTTNDGGSWVASNVDAKMEGSGLKITATKDHHKIVLNIKEFAKGKYTFDDAANHATHTTDDTDASKLFTSTNDASSYIEILNIHSDGARSDGKFNFKATDSDNNELTIDGAWLNVSKN